MENLKKSIMGKYNAEDVDKLLLKVRSDYEKCLKEQKERIIQLRDENRELAAFIKKYKDNERYIIGAITRAEETAQNIIKDAERKARERLEKAANEEKQLKVAIEGGYQRLYKLRRASEAIYRAIAKVMGETAEPAPETSQSKIRQIRNLYDMTH